MKRRRLVVGTALAPVVSAARASSPAAAAASSASATASGPTLVYPRSESGGDRRDDYPVRLLELALSRAGRRWRMQMHPVFMLQVRAMREVEAGTGLDVMWTMTSAEREQALLPIRVPIDRGLLGWRLLLVRADQAARFADVRTREGLKGRIAGQGADWPDTAILRAAGLEVDASARYGDLFLKLANRRIDYFPRSVQEIWGELAAHPGEGLAVEPRLALHYPAAMYFFVNRANKALAEDLHFGLLAAAHDGSMQALFQKHHGPAIERAGLARRTVIELPNPLLPKETPLDDPALWFRP